MVRWPSSLIVLCVLFSASLAFAQDPEPTQDPKRVAQLELNDQGVEQMSKGNYKGAIQKFERALSEYGSLDLIHLNLGRALYRDRQCLESEQQYLKAINPQTPKVGGEVSSDMDSAVKRFLTELNQTCPGYLKISCDPPEMAVYLNGEGPKSCDGTLVAVEPGRYEVVGEVKGQRTKPQVQVIERMQKASVQLSMTVTVIEKSPVVIKEDPKDDKKEPTQPQIVVITQPPPVERASTASALVFLGTGLAAVAGGMFWDTCGFSYFSQSSIDAARLKTTEAKFQEDAGWCKHTVNGSFDALDVGPAVLYVGGAILSVIGISRF